ncbi:MAG TPA: hypothetical protein VMV46_13500, partial [Thermoanaerobaculia bacterium]|nr:hypothetical protein [Thermoanaerobaculia bacterium]
MGRSRRNPPSTLCLVAPRGGPISSPEPAFQPTGARAAPVAVGYAAFFVLLSGACALIYQVAWMRQLRLVFGVSTAANAAAVGIFMAGLGVGGLWLGSRADRTHNPLRLYGSLEVWIAVAAALTPAAVVLARTLYLGAGGSLALGRVAGAVLQILLSILVLGPATLLMGGTLPAIARAAELDRDGARRATALLYGVNTLGAVLGVSLATFVWMEIVGTRRLIWGAAGLNLLIGLAARSRALRLEELVPAGAVGADAVTERVGDAGDRPSRRLVLAAAAVTGFAFFLMELVWYRMLAPLLGGSSYTFGLVLAIALLGIAGGGVAYSLRRRPPTLGSLAATCALQALAIAAPFALGDRLAVLAAALRPLGAAGFPWLVLGWAVVACAVVLPAALIAGYQFPLLLGLLGSGRRRLGRDVGVAYAINTMGALVGSLSGAFVLIPELGAPGAWRLGAGLLAALALLLLLPFARPAGVR